MNFPFNNVADLLLVVGNVGDGDLFFPSGPNEREDGINGVLLPHTAVSLAEEIKTASYVATFDSLLGGALLLSAGDARSRPLCLPGGNGSQVDALVLNGASCCVFSNPDMRIYMQ